MSERMATTIYVVRSRTIWVSDYYGHPVRSGGVAGASHLVREKAEARRPELEWEQFSSPMSGDRHFARWSHISTLPSEDCEARLRVVGLDPPADDEWWDWLSRHVGTFTPAQREAFFQAADRLNFYETCSEQVEIDGNVRTSPRYWLVRRLIWQPREAEAWGSCRIPNLDGLDRVSSPGGGEPVKLFTDPDRAAADARRRELEARVGVNPFRCHPRGPAGEEVTPFDDARLHDWCHDADITPVIGDERLDWGDWWYANADQMTEDQRSRVWEVCDRVRFFEVDEIDGPDELLTFPWRPPELPEPPPEPPAPARVPPKRPDEWDDIPF